MLLAALLGLAIALVFRLGVFVPTNEESAVSPGRTVEGYHEQAVSTYLRTSESIDKTKKQRKAQVFW